MDTMLGRTQQQLRAALYASDSSTGKNWKSAVNLRLNQNIWIAQLSLIYSSPHMHQS